MLITAQAGKYLGSLTNTCPYNNQGFGPISIDGWVLSAVLDGYLIFAEKTRSGYVEINSGTGS
jgi:hypothetical protein